VPLHLDQVMVVLLFRHSRFDVSILLATAMRRPNLGCREDAAKLYFPL
jgi:hypothetical protein